MSDDDSLAAHPSETRSGCQSTTGAGHAASRPATLKNVRLYVHRPAGFVPKFR
jgi:hypothetical protein